MVYKLKDTLLRVIILFFGLTIAHFGVTLFLLADIGADPFNVFVQGIFRFTGQIPGWPIHTHGNTHVAISFLIILILLVVDRTYIKLGTVLCMIFGGPIIDIFTLLLSDLFTSVSTLPLKIIINGIGCIILAFGMTIVMKSEAGTGPNDLVGICISDKLKKNFGIIRMVVDISFVLIGFLFGGSFGVGTLICAFLVGPVANIFLPINEKWIKKVVSQI